MSVIWLFPKQFSENPLIKNFIPKVDIYSDEYQKMSSFQKEIVMSQYQHFAFFQVVWFSSLLLFCFTWFILWHRENRDEQLKKSLMLERNINNMFFEFINYTLSVENNKVIFTKDQLVDFIESGNRRIDQDLAQSLGEIIIQKGLAKKVIENVDNQSLSDAFIYKGSR